MAQDIDRAGNFRGEIVDYGLSEQESGALAVSIEARIEECWDEENKEWVTWREYDIHAIGYIYVIKKDGTLNDKQVQALVQCAGWDGSFDSIADHSWQPTPCQFVVNEDNYNNQKRYRISWVNAYDRTPGALGQMSPDRVKQLSQKYGSQLRAVAGNAKPVAKPSGKPKAPSAPAKNQQPAPVAAESGDDVPF